MGFPSSHKAQDTPLRLRTRPCGSRHAPSFRPQATTTPRPLNIVPRPQTDDNHAYPFLPDTPHVPPVYTSVFRLVYKLSWLDLTTSIGYCVRLRALIRATFTYVCIVEE